ncbi:hypothetical protein [Streptomyces omiyaensis]|uniref:Secreted protein n=1 Tax=Streptomyces omiyaensis TaxID=68247 RepID=A0ABW7C0Y9_9ACTN
MLRTRPRRASLIAPLTVATLAATTASVHADTPRPVDKDLGVNTLTGCFRGPGYTSQGVWNVHVDGGTKRYFTIPALNGSVYTKATVSVSRIHVDTTAAD